MNPQLRGNQLINHMSLCCRFPQSYFLEVVQDSWTQLYPLSHYFSSSLQLSSSLRQLLHFFLSLFIYLFLVFLSASGGYSLLRCTGFSLLELLLLWSTGSRERAQKLWCAGLAVLWHAGSSQTRDPTCAPCLGRQISHQGSLLVDCFLPFEDSKT